MTDIPGFHVEAKLHGFRRTAEGVVVSFVVSPIDMPHQLATDPLGTRYQLGICEIGNDEQPSRRDAPFPSAAERPGVEPSASPPARARASQIAEARYANSNQMQQALVRAGALARDVPFIDWCIGYNPEAEPEDLIERAAQYIRNYCCQGRSRSLIATDPECWRRFTELEMKYKVGAGRMAEPR